jgi:hypothetical protein
VERPLESGPYNSYEDFKAACLQSPERINLHRDVLNDAQKYFKIKDKNDLLSLIGNGEFEHIKFQKPTKHKYIENVFIDAYLFKLDRKIGYLAFFEHNGGWLLKSFHPGKTKPGYFDPPGKMLEVSKVIQLPKVIKTGGQNE